MIVCSTVKLKPNKITSLFNKTSNIWKTGHNPGEWNSMPKTAIYLVYVEKVSTTYNYSLDNTILQQVPSNAYLDITIAEDLKWNSHINNITKKVNSTLGFLRRNLRSCPPSSRRSAYVSLIRPALEYSTVVWDPYKHVPANRYKHHWVSTTPRH